MYVHDCRLLATNPVEIIEQIIAVVCIYLSGCYAETLLGSGFTLCVPKITMWSAVYPKNYTFVSNVKLHIILIVRTCTLFDTSWVYMTSFSICHRDIGTGYHKKPPISLQPFGCRWHLQLRLISGRIFLLFSLWVWTQTKCVWLQYFKLNYHLNSHNKIHIHAYN